MKAEGRSINRSAHFAVVRASALVLAGGLLPASVALAQTSGRDPAGAEELFRQGVAAKSRGDWNAACDKFRKSMELDPNVSAQYKVAYCDERAGNLATAWLGYLTALKLNRETKSDKRRSELDKAIKDAIAALEPKVPKLRISISPNDPKFKLELERDKVTLDAASVIGEALPVDPGEHTIVVRAPGFVEQTVTVTVIEGRTVEAAIQLVQAPIAENPPVLPLPPTTVPLPQRPPANANHTFANGDLASPSTDSQRGAHWGQKQTALVVGGAGLATLGVAAYFGIRTLSEVGKMSQYKNSDGETYNSGVYGPHDRALQFQLAGLVLAGAGAAMTGLGIGLYATAPKSVGASRFSVTSRYTAAVTPSGAFLRGQW
jgi:hypothetical protein